MYIQQYIYLIYTRKTLLCIQILQLLYQHFIFPVWSDVPVYAILFTTS